MTSMCLFSAHLPAHALMWTNGHLFACSDQVLSGRRVTKCSLACIPCIRKPLKKHVYRGICGQTWPRSRVMLCAVTLFWVTESKEERTEAGQRNWVVHWHLSLPLWSSRTVGEEQLRCSHPSHITSFFLHRDVRPRGASHWVLHLWFCSLYAFLPLAVIPWAVRIAGFTIDI